MAVRNGEMGRRAMAAARASRTSKAQAPTSYLTLAAAAINHNVSEKYTKMANVILDSKKQNLIQAVDRGQETIYVVYRECKGSRPKTRPNT